MSKLNLELKTSELNLQNALILARASSIAYESEETIKGFVSQNWGIEDFTFIQKEDTECFIVADENIIILAFRGTEQSSLKDWMTDFKARKVSGPWRMGVHRGFKNALEVVWDDIENKICDLLEISKRQLCICGHSLGGALATLATAKFLENRESVACMYTFGQPMVGSKAFAEKFDRCFKNVYRFVNNEDIVTRVPFGILGFSHIGIMCYFDNEGKLHNNPDMKFVIKDRLEGVEVRNTQSLSHLRHLYPNEFEDHSLDRYIYYIEKNIKIAERRSRPEGDFLDYING